VEPLKVHFRYILKILHLKTDMIIQSFSINILKHILGLILRILHM